MMPHFNTMTVMAAMDILLNLNGKWYAFEVKANTSVKDHHLADEACAIPCDYRRWPSIRSHFFNLHK